MQTTFPSSEGWQAKPDGVVSSFQGNERLNSPPSEGWQAKPEGVVSSFKGDDGLIPPPEGWQAMMG